MYLAGVGPNTPADPPPRLAGLWPVFDNNPAGEPGDELQNWSSLIGIITAICGNVIIALALNVQRYAHIRLHRERALVRERAKQALKNAASAQGRGGSYGSTGSSTADLNGNGTRHNGHRLDEDALVAQETQPLTGSFQSGDSRWSEFPEDEGKKATSTYLQDPYWWLGQVLITIGEMGNFLAYGFAPASIVSPLGVVALVSNCVIAPIFFKEVFRPRDFWGVIIAITGAVTVVLSAKQEETKLGPHEVWDAITTMAFEIYMGVSCSLIALLMWLSPRYGNRTILIDLGLVGLFGGYTALATKGVSSMLSSTLLGAFATPVTYALIFILLSTAVMQVRYLNKALARFDSTQVIPIQFVSFTLCVIIGSAVLYRDFERTTTEQAAKFIGGCFLTFFGVFLITSGRPRHDEDEDTLSDAEGIEETINLSEQGRGGAQMPHHPSRRDSNSTSSRRSSRASVSFKDTINKPLAALTGTGFPTLRAPIALATSRPIFAQDDGEDAPLISGLWRDPAAGPPPHPGAGTHTISSDSVPTIASTAVSDDELLAQPNMDIPTTHITTSSTPLIERPVTPPTRTALSTSRPHSHHFGGPVISPSPFSSTVSAVVTDKLLVHLDSPTMRRVASRRSRPSLRNSLFVPQDEVYNDCEEPEDEGLRETVSAVDRPLVEDDIDERKKGGVRGRARSLSHTLGELFGVRRARRGVMVEDEEDGLLGEESTEAS
ncbi:magnesium transporter NIPA-domain-containing protein [Lasiosphaeris hirsuta]|uniref:Magnesium transporter NIPA-domain-containing protein n=1 Tax=Lasiosphaeris hirsuta TaxID=260670 RepID=A0AA40A9J8_9PEZI|nr:magnesium transporter NIPA-domain-containing protein [Lasiosphaeris hirsuta]